MSNPVQLNTAKDNKELTKYRKRSTKDFKLRLELRLGLGLLSLLSFFAAFQSFAVFGRILSSPAIRLRERFKFISQYTKFQLMN